MTGIMLYPVVIQDMLISFVCTGVGPQNVGQISVQHYWTQNLSNDLFSVLTQNLGAKLLCIFSISILPFILVFFLYVEVYAKIFDGPQNVGLDFWKYLTGGK